MSKLESAEAEAGFYPVKMPVFKGDFATNDYKFHPKFTFDFTVLHFFILL